MFEASSVDVGSETLGAKKKQTRIVSDSTMYIILRITFVFICVANHAFRKIRVLLKVNLILAFQFCHELQISTRQILLDPLVDSSVQFRREMIFPVPCFSWSFFFANYLHDETYENKRWRTPADEIQIRRRV